MNAPRWSRSMVLLVAVSACGSSDPAPPPAPTSAVTTTSSSTGGAGGATSTGGNGQGGDGGHGGAGGSLTFADVAFTPVDFPMPEWIGTTRELVLFPDATAFESYFGVAAPPAIDWSTEDALLYTEGAQPFPGPIATVEALSLREDGGELRIETQLRSPGNGCEVLQWDPPAYQLVTLPALSSVPVVSEQHGTTSFDCSADGASANSSCTEVDLCGENLVCGGLTRFSPGLCYPASQRGVFTQTGQSTIPDGSPSGLDSALAVSGLATVDVDVIVEVTLDHPDWSQLTITLENPDGNVVTVWTEETAPVGATTLHRVPIGFSGDESVNGTWTLTVVDGASGESGSLEDWSLEIVSRLD